LPASGRVGISLGEVRRALAADRRRGAAAGPHYVTPLELPAQGDSRPAAVLCLLFEEDGETSVVLTRRSAHLRSHGGEVSFAGGRLHPGERPLQAALREANEEIGVDSGAVEVIGELTPLTTRRSPALVYCFVGTFPGPGPGGAALHADASEVDKVFWASLAGLAADGIFHEELWPAPPPAGHGPGPVTYRAVPFFVVGDDIVWGATGRLLSELLAHVLAPRGAGGSSEGSLVK
jgi:8-oxo-dGTP pyrophosphatase MutT (NUDIX family)